MPQVTRVLGEEMEPSEDKMDGMGVAEGRRCSW